MSEQSGEFQAWAPWLSTANIEWITQGSVCMTKQTFRCHSLICHHPMYPPKFCAYCGGPMRLTNYDREGPYGWYAKSWKRGIWQ